MAEEVVIGFEEFDDDAYYLELKKRILLLMVDDEEDDLELFRNYGQISHPETTRFENKLVCSVDGQVGENFDHKVRRHEAPSWMVNLWRISSGSTGNGTGVFIPKVINPRRRQRQGRRNNKSSGRRMDQQV